jgi:peptidoglycan/LPS O-acetylase OafA/YrhL
MKTFAELHDEAKGRPSGFDYLRIGLAVSVVLFHLVGINYGEQAQLMAFEGKFGPLAKMVVPMFFGLSGFLVAGSLLRSRTILGFLFLRGIRIFPALAVEICVSAVFLGLIFTTCQTGAYLRADEFHSYFLNILGDIHYRLPGVFAGNPLPYRVNGQLWTIPYELRCYIAAAVLAIFGIHRQRRWFLLITVLAQMIMAERILAHGPVMEDVPGNVVVVCFLCGILFYLYRDRIMHSAFLAVGSAVLCAVLLCWRDGSYLMAAPAVYLTCYLGLLNPGRIRVIQSGDYSYGIYLYGFPVQQAVAALGGWTHQWALSFVLSFPVIVLVAYFSWHVVESRALRARKWQSKVDALWIGLVSRLPLPNRLSKLGIGSKGVAETSG